MKKIIVFLIVLQFFSQASAQWYPQQSGTNTELGEVFFLDENHGWVTGINFFGFGDSLLLRTTDSGLSWDSIAAVGYKNYHFIDSLIGFAMGGNFENLYQTNDGGFTWSINFEGNVKDYEFFDLNDGILMSGDSGIIFKTLNNQWQNSDTLYNYQNYNFFSEFSEMDFINPDTGYATYYSQIYQQDVLNYHFLKTTDGGLNWTMCTGSVPNIFPVAYDLTFISDNWGLLKTSYNGTFKTIDGSGSEWENISPGWVDYYFIDSLNGWIIKSGGIFSTNDGGNSWENQYPENGLLAISFADSNNGWAVGTNGLILHTNNGGGTVGVADQLSNVNKKLEIYPNPASKTITCGISVKASYHDQIYIYDITGRLVLYDHRSAKEGQLKLDISDLDPGAYLLKISTDESILTGKFIKK